MQRDPRRGPIVCARILRMHRLHIDEKSHAMINSQKLQNTNDINWMTAMQIYERRIHWSAAVPASAVKVASMRLIVSLTE